MILVIELITKLKNKGSESDSKRVGGKTWNEQKLLLLQIDMP